MSSFTKAGNTDLAVRGYVTMLMLLSLNSDNHTQVILDREKKFWEKVSVAYMTEESDDPDNSSQLVTHHIPWRSQSWFCL